MESFNCWREYLELQVKLFAAAEIELFKRHGLGELNSPLIDIGCGNGAYARFLKSQLPELNISCVDTDPVRLAEFEASLLTTPLPGVTQAVWSVSKEPPPATIQKHRSALMRYVVQYADDSVDFLRAVSEVLEPGATIFIVEEDDGFYKSFPAFRALERFLEINRAWADKYGCSREMGREIPAIVIQAGFRVKHVEVLTHSNFSVDANLLIRYFELALAIVASSTPDVISATEAKKVADQMREFLAVNQSSCFFFYPQIVTIAEKA